MTQPGSVPLGSTGHGAYATSDVFVGVPAIAAGGSAVAGTGSFTATIPGIQIGDLLILQPPLDVGNGQSVATSVTYAGHRITAANTVVVFFRSGGAAAVAAQTAVAWRYNWFKFQPVAEVLGQNPS